MAKSLGSSKEQICRLSVALEPKGRFSTGVSDTPKNVSSHFLLCSGMLLLPFFYKTFPKMLFATLITETWKTIPVKYLSEARFAYNHLLSPNLTWC